MITVQPRQNARAPNLAVWIHERHARNEPLILLDNGRHRLTRALLRGVVGADVNKYFFVACLLGHLVLKSPKVVNNRFKHHTKKKFINKNKLNTKETAHHAVIMF